MSQTFGSINFGNIPVAAPSGISVAGARQGVSYNAGYIELGSDDPFNTAWWVTDQRYIRVSGALWALDTASAGGFGWRIQSNLMTILNDGEEWSFLQDSGNSYFRIESLGAERGIQWYNTGAPTGERAFVGYNNTQGLIIRDSTTIGGGIKMRSNVGNIVMSVAGANVVTVSDSYVDLLGGISIDAPDDEIFDLTGRGVSLGFPVPILRPRAANSRLAFDLIPNGSPSVTPGDPITWFDVCDSDVYKNENPVACARVGITDTAIQLGSVAFNGASVKPVNFIVGSGNIVSTYAADGSLNYFTNRFNISRTTADGDYLGATVFNGNNGNASSIIFIGNQFGTFPNQNFGFIRWNCGGVAPSTYINPNQLDILANSGAVNGMVIGVTEPAPVKFLVHDEVARFSEDGYFGIGVTTPAALLDVAAGTVNRASMKLGAGVAPTVPGDGDIWFDGTNLFMRVGGVTKTFTLV